MESAIEQMGDEAEYARIPAVPHSQAHKCEVDGCNISQEEHHRLAFGMIAENRALKRRVAELENMHPAADEPEVTPPLATRDAIEQAINDVVVTHAMWIGDDGRELDYLPEREARIADFVREAAAAVLGILSDPASLAETPDFLYRVTNRAIPIHPTGRVTVTETQAVLRALAAALTEDPS